jgi:hypothetical protein
MAKTEEKDDALAANAAGKQPRRRRAGGRPFVAGKSGNPRGKAHGTRHNITVLAERLMGNDVKVVVAQVVEKAKGGDMTAARLILDRIVPARRGRPVQFTLPVVVTTADLVAALGAILAAVAAGELTPDEGAAVAGLIESKRKAIEIVELEARVAALEKQKGTGP